MTEPTLHLTTEWDKTFPKSDKVTHRKITFHNRYGIPLAADLYTPKDAGWNRIGCISFLNQPILAYANEIRSAVLLVHGKNAHSCYFSKDAYAAMCKDNAYTENKRLLLLADTVHTDLYDRTDKIPFDEIQAFFRQYL